ncbi:unnamed protein product [Nippostrongylus brasiliensis]|uniref:Uncharacterized protein n=1 Tax=Nippostrongylus brasiliensis TaxID=27835 RepID=A0A0N4XRJ6_NIPBR|nr:unnamed protein product [Nippostrongylus brasiliensis]
MSCHESETIPDAEMELKWTGGPQEEMELLKVCDKVPMRRRCADSHGRRGGKTLANQRSKASEL